MNISFNVFGLTQLVNYAKSLAREAEDVEAWLASVANYAAAVEFGTDSRGPDGTVREAVESVQKEIDSGTFFTPGDFEEFLIDPQDKRFEDFVFQIVTELRRRISETPPSGVPRDTGNLSASYDIGVTLDDARRVSRQEFLKDGGSPEDVS